MKPRILIVTALALGIALPAHAEATIGLGISAVFGSGQMDTGIGLRVFSDNQRDKVAGTIGLDYMFKSKKLRPTIGAAYLGKNAYIGLDMGIDIQTGGIDFGVGVGAMKSKKPKAAAPVVVPPHGSDA